MLLPREFAMTWKTKYYQAKPLNQKWNLVQEDLDWESWYPEMTAKYIYLCAALIRIQSPVCRK